jgi:multidrug efflux pump
MILVVASMGFRSGLVVGLGIPFSLLFSVTIIYLLGYTFNFMVMFGMLLALGMLIDGGIVVTEYANRMMSEGMGHRRAYIDAVNRMFWPVTASTATTLAAFLPMLFWPGVSGQFMGYLPVTVFTVLIGSLLYALLFGPVLGTLFGKPSMHDAQMLETQYFGGGRSDAVALAHRPVCSLYDWRLLSPFPHTRYYFQSLDQRLLGLWKVWSRHHFLF